MLEILINWTGPFSIKKVIARINKGGVPPKYDGEDYGLYQIYGRHILGDHHALLYVGEAIEQTFSARFREHQSWLNHEYPVQVYVGTALRVKETYFS